MLKIIPLIIIPLFFFIIFLGVENLTQISDAKKENIRSELEKLDQKDDFLEKTAENIQVTNKVSPDENKDEGIIVKETKNNKDLKKDQEAKKLKNPPKAIKKPIKIKMQFGAFKKKDYANSSKQSIEKKIKQKFPDFSIIVNFDNKKNLYKLIHFSEDLSIAKEVCEFSKKKKIGCLIVKK